ncbi:MAG: TrkH family potassium uptake protein, partial [Clostridia bacterium]|nr:TrkH family potassium uptake protein [Clostridia bacterium]
MNYRMTFYMMGIIAVVEAILLSIPFFIAIGLLENTILSFGITIAILLSIGIPLIIFKPKDVSITPKEGFIIVALAWITMSLFGSLPFFLSGNIPNYIDAVFETVSGFTTTGATIINNVEILPKSILFWRSFTQWIGGMGVLVFILAILPKADPKFFHIFRAEATGPQVGKLVSKLKFTAQILYAIYIALTILQIIMLSFKMPFFESVLHSFTTASTGGFSNKNLSIAAFNSVYIDTVITIFMILFSINFNIFFLILLGKFKDVLRSEELKVFISIVAISMVVVSISLYAGKIYATFGESFRYSSFQVASLMSTTGFTTADYTKWPMLAQFILFFLMIIGGSAGSTAGGLKVSRLIILVKSGFREIKSAVSPRSINTIRLDNKPIDYIIAHSTMRYFILYLTILCTSVLLVSISNPAMRGSDSLMINFSAVLTSLGNTGPFFGDIGAAGNFSNFSYFSKIIFALNMLIG